MSTANDAAVLENLPIFENAQSWTRPEMARRSDWIHEFTLGEIDEIDAAVSHLDTLGTDIRTIDKSMFPLPQLGALVNRTRQEILFGRGFHLFRGIPVE